MIIALDFDRVIHDTDNPKPGRRMGPPMDGTAHAINVMLEEGHEVFVHTCMAQNPAGLRAVRDWLKWYELPPLPVVSKPTADLYVDDKAMRFEGWNDVLDVLPWERS